MKVEIVSEPVEQPTPAELQAVMYPSVLLEADGREVARKFTKPPAPAAVAVSAEKEYLASAQARVVLLLLSAGGAASGGQQLLPHRAECKVLERTTRRQTVGLLVGRAHFRTGASVTAGKGWQPSPSDRATHAAVGLEKVQVLRLLPVPSAARSIR